jgi:hypothetical protein
MLNEKTRAVLSSLTKVNNSIIHTYPIISVRSAKNMFAFFDCSKHGEEQFEEFGTFDTTEMLTLVGLIEKPEINISDRIMTIKNDKNKVVYLTSKLLMLEDTCRTDSTLISRMKANSVLTSFDLSQKDIETAIKASTLLKGLDNFIITANDDKVNIEVRGDEKSSNTFEIVTNATVNESVEFTLSMSYISRLPSGDYSITLNKNPKGTIVAIFTHKGIEGLDLVISGKAK